MPLPIIQMISWHNAPIFRYQGYVYSPEVHEYDDGIRKASHNVYKEGREHLTPALPEFTIDESPYRWISYDLFTYHVDMMYGNVYGDVK